MTELAQLEILGFAVACLLVFALGFLIARAVW